MKRFVLVSLLMSLCFTSSLTADDGITKLSPYLRSLCKKYAAKPVSRGVNPDIQVRAFVAFSGEEERELLENKGCTILAESGGVLIADIPKQRVVELASDSRIARIEAEPAGEIQLDSVSLQVDADPAYMGRGLPQAFTGSGVVAGIVDVGFDFNHPTFRSSDGTLRVSRFWDMLARNSSYRYGGAVYENKSAIKRVSHSRDAIYINHGTHVLGIEAGSGVDSNYCGLAPDADICAVSCYVDDDATWLADSVPEKLRSETNKALAFKYIFDYAASVNKPCVVNFSIGSSSSFFESSRLGTRFIESLTGPGRIIVCSAGNSGNAYRHVQKPAYNTRRFGTAFYQSNSRGSEFAMSIRRSRPVEWHLSVYRNMYDATCDTTFALPASLFRDSGAEQTAAFPFNGGRDTLSLLCYTFVSPYNTTDTIDYIVLTGIPLERYTSHTEYPVYALWTPDAGGERIDIFQHNFPTYTQMLTEAGLGVEYADRNYTVSQQSESEKLISVGASAHRFSYTSLAGGNYRTAADSVYAMHASWSSMGPGLNERLAPDVVAPGLHIVSASNSCLLQRADVSRPSAKDIMAHSDYDGKQYDWIQMSGTSMAAPVVSGVIALWLEADPTLTPDGVRTLLASTSRHIDPNLRDADYPNTVYGYGEVDAYRGLLSLLKLDGVKNLPNYQPRGASFELRDRTLQVTFGSRPHRAVLSVYSVEGRLVMQCSYSGGEVDLSALPAGVYAVSIKTDSASTTGSTLIRLH